MASAPQATASPASAGPFAEPAIPSYTPAGMPYEIVLAPEAVADLRHLQARDRATIRAALEQHLRHAPAAVSRSRIKRLRGLSRPQYRLRVGDFRVFYDIDGQTVEVLAIIPKLAVDEWLARAGEPDEGSSTL
jgi:mRNA interferase RelE/StbE